MHFLYSLLVAVIVFVVGLIFDKTPDKRWAGLAALISFVLTFLGYAQIVK